jgi:RNA-directed DNA polymerase
MSKATSGSSTALSTPVLQIALPLEWASDTASASPDATRPPSGAATPAAAKEAKPRKWYSLYDKVYALPNLRRAWEQVRANQGAPGCDGQTVKQFAAHEDENLDRLHHALREKRYRPQPVRRVEIPKSGGGTRPLGIPTVRDRIVQQALLQILSPIFEAQFSPRSHGFRPGRGCETALDVVDRAVRHGYEWVVDADISKFFDNVDHELLLERMNEQIADGSVLKLVRAFLKSGVLLEGGELEPTELGTPQGGPLSPLLANIYLHPFDEAMVAAGLGLVRYADDFVIFAKSSEGAGEALELARGVLQGLKLNLHPEKTRIAAIDEGFEFLGYRYVRDSKGRVQKVVSSKSRRKFRERIRELTPRHGGQRRPKPRQCKLQRLRHNGRVLGMVGGVSKYLCEWHGYFRGVRTDWKRYWDDQDKYVRQRLRNAISGRYAKGHWQRVLNNAMFARLGLVSLEQLHAACPAGPLRAAPNLG